MLKRFFSSVTVKSSGSVFKFPVDLKATLRREDYNGNKFIMRENIPVDEAHKLAAMYEERGHHQFYTVEVHPDRGFAGELPSLEQSVNEVKVRLC
jgi:hypothetical protein